MAEKGRIEGLIEQGQVWQVSHTFAVIGIGADVFIHILTGAIDAGRFFLDFTAQTLFQGTLELFEDPTLSADGTELTAYNMRRDIVTPPHAKVFHTPTVSADGTLLDSKLVSEGGAFAGLPSGTYDPDREWILKPASSYLIKHNNTSGIGSLGVFGVVFREDEVN